MKPQGLDVTFVDIGGVHIVRLSGELDLASADGLAERIVEIAGSAVVVDLADLSFMDSSGLSALIVAKNRLAERGDSLVLSRPEPRVSRVLEVTGLADWVTNWSPEWSESDTDT